MLKELDDSHDTNKDCLEAPAGPPGSRMGREPEAGSSPVRNCGSMVLCKESSLAYAQNLKHRLGHVLKKLPYDS